MTVPKAKYVVDSDGQKLFVQIAVKDWENLLTELERYANLLSFKTKLKDAFREVNQIKKGKKIGIPLSQLIDEL